jgi:serine/threonine protein kinase
MLFNKLSSVFRHDLNFRTRSNGNVSQQSHRDESRSCDRQTYRQAFTDQFYHRRFLNPNMNEPKLKPAKKILSSLERKIKALGQARHSKMPSTASLRLADSQEANLFQSETMPTLLADPDCEEFFESYRIVSKIGSGGMGVVYKAKHKTLDKTVALKMLHKELAVDPVNVRRFEVEAKAASLLTHPNLAAVYETGTTKEGSPFLVMDYLNGLTLEQILKCEGFLSREKFFEIFSQVCEALTHAHNKQIIHRDLKPSNIMILKKDGEPDFVKLLDFGIARVLQRATKDGSRLTQTGEVIGSPVYMSPEQCLGIGLDERSDIYSLGVVMYEALAGVPPFSGNNSIQIIVGHINQKPKPISKLRPDFKIPPELDDLILECLEKAPEKRFQSIDKLQRALEQIRDNSKQSKRRLSWRKFRNTLTKKNILIATSVASLCAALYLMNSLTHSNKKTQATWELQERWDQQAKASKETYDQFLDLALVASWKGEVKRCIDLYTRALKIGEQIHLSPEELYQCCYTAGCNILSLLSNEQIKQPLKDSESREILLSSKPFLQKAIVLSESNLSFDEYKAYLLTSLAETYHIKHDYKAEENLLNRAIEYLQNNGVSNHPEDYFRALYQLTALLIVQKQYSQAEATLIKAIDFQANTSEAVSDLYNNASPQLRLCKLYKALNQLDKLEVLAGKLAKEDSANKSFEHLSEWYSYWEQSLKLQGKLTEAKKVRDIFRQFKNANPDYENYAATPKSPENSELGKLDSWTHLIPEDDPLEAIFQSKSDCSAIQLHSEMHK